MSTEPIDARRSGEPVTVRDFDRVDTRTIEGQGDVHRLLARVLMPNGVHPVAQGDVTYVEARVGHRSSFASAPEATAPPSIRCLIRSAVVTAAEVMMSRLPAYAG